jgi:L,D-transpeptidase catalytic domain
MYLIYFELYLTLFSGISSSKKDFYISTEAVKRARIHKEPSKNSPLVGAVVSGTRFPLVATLKKIKCHKGYYIKLGENMYSCSSSFKLSYGFPGGKIFPQVKKGNLMHTEVLKVITPRTPTYGSKRDIKNKRSLFSLPNNTWIKYRKKFKRVDGVLYALSGKGVWIPWENLDKKTVSKFAGKHIKNLDTYLDPAIIISLKGALIWRKPGKGLNRKISRRTWIKLIKNKVVKVNKKRYFKLDTGEWVGEWNIKRFFFTSPPLFLNKKNNRWMEVVLKEQTLVVYEGSRPVFMTLISSARKGFVTPTGVFRIYFKRGTQDISSKRGKKWLHLFEEVPWIQFFKGVLAIHTAYWHDLFGNPYSMGCIELSPRDSRFLYGWTKPMVSPGFLSVNQTEKNIGTLLRIVKFPNQKVNYRGKVKYLNL